ncbi:MAG: hypothetical protein ACREID_00990, partial [Planctomycetota bacterium]
LGPLARLLAEAMREQERVEEKVKRVQKRGADARERMLALDKEIAQLEMKERAGSADLGPQIEQRIRDKELALRDFDQVQLAVEDLSRQLAWTKELREKLAGICSAILRAQADATAAEGIAALRGALDVAVREEALFLVRILRAAESRAAAPALVDILSHPQADPGCVRAASFALAPLKDRSGTEALIRLWEREPETHGPYLRECLSIASGRRLETVAEARTWAATLN